MVRAYKLLLSHSLGNACRFEPTCSVYALQVLDSRGAVVGAYLTLHRLVRCNPWCEAGHDPVKPAQPMRIFTGLTTPKKSTLPSEKTSL